jgi:diacylglycerol kinase family enzyme
MIAATVLAEQRDHHGFDGVEGRLPYEFHRVWVPGGTSLRDVAQGLGAEYRMVKALNLTPYPGRVIVPGEDPSEGSMLFAAVGNNHFAGGGFDIAPLAKINDGLLDLTAIRADRGVQLASLAKEFEDPMNPDNKHIAYRQLAEFTIESEQKLHCNLDGEPVRKKKLHFSVLPRHLKVAY